MVEQWSAGLSGMQFSTRDQVCHPSLFVSADKVKKDDCDNAEGGH